MTNNLSPKLEHLIERAGCHLQMARFDQAKHLAEREKPYCEQNLMAHGIFVIRETEDGWWRESVDFKGDISKQIEKLQADPTVACGWINHSRFNEPGGWYDPS